MDDLISRQAALKSQITMVAQGLDWIPAYHIEQLPSAERHGQWIEEDNAIIHGHCSSCGWSAIWQETDVFGMPYCPNCGSHMNMEDIYE